MTDHDEPRTPEGNAGTDEHPDRSSATDEIDPTFSEGTGRDVEDAAQPLAREDEGMDR